MRLFDLVLQASVGAYDAAGFIRLPMKYLSHTQFLLRMLFCVPGFMLILGFAKGCQYPENFTFVKFPQNFTFVKFEVLPCMPGAAGEQGVATGHSRCK